MGACKLGPCRERLHDSVLSSTESGKGGNAKHGNNLRAFVLPTGRWVVSCPPRSSSAAPFSPPSCPCSFHAKQTDREKVPSGFPAAPTPFWMTAHTAWGGLQPFISSSCLVSEQLPPTAGGTRGEGERIGHGGEAVIFGDGEHEGWLWKGRGRGREPSTLCIQPSCKLEPLPL